MTAEGRVDLAPPPPVQIQVMDSQALPRPVETARVLAEVCLLYGGFSFAFEPVLYGLFLFQTCQNIGHTMRAVLQERTQVKEAIDILNRVLTGPSLTSLADQQAGLMGRYLSSLGEVGEVSFASFKSAKPV